MAIRYKVLFFLLVLSAVAPTTGRGQTLSGRLTGSLYFYERSDSTDVASTHARGFQAFRFHLAQKNVSLSTYAQIDGDFSTPAAGDARFRVYNLQLEWKNIAGKGAVRIGRQPIFAGVAVGTVDGARIRVEAANWLRIKAFGGGLLPANQGFDLVQDLNRNYMIGGQAVVAPVPEVKVSLSYLDKRQRREGFITQRSDSIGNVFSRLVRPSDRSLQLASVDAVWNVRSTTAVTVRGDYDFHGNRLTRGEVSGRTSLSSRFRLDGGYTYRSPRLPWNSIFSVFNIEENHEVEGRIYVRVRPDLRFHGEAAGIRYTDDSSYRGVLGLQTRHFSVSYVHRGGYAGNLDGVNASFAYPLRKGSLIPMAQLSWAAYRTSSDPDERRSLFSGRARLTVRPRQSLTVDGELQLINNPHYSADARFLIRFQYWFFRKFGAGS